jgi:hypothetical protein
LEDQLAWPKFEAPQESQFFHELFLDGNKKLTLHKTLTHSEQEPQALSP